MARFVVYYRCVVDYYRLRNEVEFCQISQGRLEDDEWEVKKKSRRESYSKTHTSSCSNRKTRRTKLR